MQDPVFVDTSEGKILVADSLKPIGDVNKIDEKASNKKNKTKPEMASPEKPKVMTSQEVEKIVTNNVSPTNIETRRGK